MNGMGVWKKRMNWSLRMERGVNWPKLTHASTIVFFSQFQNDRIDIMGELAMFFKIVPEFWAGFLVFFFKSVMLVTDFSNKYYTRLLIKHIFFWNYQAIPWDSNKISVILEDTPTCLRILVGSPQPTPSRDQVAVGLKSHAPKVQLGACLNEIRAYYTSRKTIYYHLQFGGRTPLSGWAFQHNSSARFFSIAKIPYMPLRWSKLVAFTPNVQCYK